VTRLRHHARRLLASLRSRRMDDDFRDEIAGHLAEATDEFVRRGLPPDEARLAALRSFGRDGYRRTALDRVNEAARFTRCGDEVVPAPGGEVSAVPADAGNLAGDGVQPVKIVQQPAVEAVGPEGGLNGGDVEPGCRLGHPASIAWRPGRVGGSGVQCGPENRTAPVR